MSSDRVDRVATVVFLRKIMEFWSICTEKESSGTVGVRDGTRLLERGLFAGPSVSQQECSQGALGAIMEEHREQDLPTPPKGRLGRVMCMKPSFPQNPPLLVRASTCLTT